MIWAPNSKQGPKQPGLIRGSLDDPDEIDLLTSKIHTTEEGHLVGIYQAEGIDPLQKRRIPARVIPLRAEPTEAGEQNLAWLCGGQAVTLSFDPDSLPDLQVAEIPEDVPEYRLATMDPEYLASFDPDE